MATRDSVMARGRRKGASAKERFCEEIRIGRVGLGLSQASASSRVGISRASWTRYEAGERDVPSWDVAGRMAAAVGLDLVVQLFPSELDLRDTPQVTLLGDLRTVLGPGWSWRYEVRVGPAPDQRAWDAVAEHRDTRLTIRVDAETRIADCQRVLRKTRSKAAAWGSRPRHPRGARHHPRPRQYTSSRRGPAGGSSRPRRERVEP